LISEKTCETTSSDSALIKETPFNSFRFFFFEVFSVAVYRLEGEFIPSDHFIYWCSFLQAYPKTSIKSARHHIKSATAIAYMLWKIYRMKLGLQRYSEWLYMGYKEDLASYQLKKAKMFLKELPEYFGDFEDMTKAEGILKYKFRDTVFICEPSGILTFKRGRHPHGIICDDILKDPEVKLDISQLEKITKAFKEEIMPMPKDEIHVFGTPQDREDLFSVLEKMPSFKCLTCPAVINHEEKKVLWPEKYPYEKLMEIKRDITPKAFNKEYQCMPVRGEEAFFREPDLDKVIKSRLRHYSVKDKPLLNEFTFGGHDIGKKAHPSHFVVFGVDRKNKLIQLHSKWMDGWNYVDQIEYIQEAIDAFNIQSINYDDTRAEFEGFSEQGDLPAEMSGVCFTLKSKFGMAASFEKFVTQDKIRLLSEKRQKSQILNVDNDLKAVQTPEGHGDSFFSICLAIKAYLETYGVGICVI